EQVEFAARASAALTGQFSPEQQQAHDAAASTSDELNSLVNELQTNTVQNASKNLPRIRELLSTISNNYQQFTSVDPRVLVEPLQGEVQLATPRVDKVTDWYAPAAIVLMLQQFGVAFGALSFVRERQLGTLDLYKVAPLNATETLVGKYLAYLLIG